MNIETRLSEPLRRAVESAYDRRDYTAAILDAIFFLGDVIRERTGLDCDGVALVGQAFGGKSPKLKVNKLESESERNVQQGVESMLRGLYQAIRNPRSHEKLIDSEQDADAIIPFVDFLLRIINQSKAPFEKKEYLGRVFDWDFVESDRYANLLVQDIPEGKRVEIFLDAFRVKETGKGKKLQFFFRALLSVMSEEDREQALRIVEEELTIAGKETPIRMAIQLIPAEYWETLSEVVRMRIENKLIASVASGRYLTYSEECEAGTLGTWITTLLGHLLLREQLVSTLFAKLNSGSEEEKDYVFRFFISHFPELVQTPTAWQIRILGKGLEAGDKRFKEALSFVLWSGEAWAPLVKKYEDFKEADETNPPDGQEEKDEVPF